MKRSTLILLINFSVLALVVLVGLAAQLAPYFTCSVVGICVVTFLFILTEQWFTHDAVEFENRFWTFMAFVLAAICLFCPDSPVKFAEDRPGLAWTIVVVFSFLVHNYDRHMHRLVLARKANIRRVKSADFGAEDRSNAQQKVLEIRRLLSMIDHTWMSSTFLNLFFLPRVLYVERQIISIMSEANNDELNLIICNIELALLFYKVKDHRVARRFHRTRLLHLLAMDRISGLAVPSRVVLLDGLQRMKLSAHPQSEQLVKNIIINTKAEALTELKCLTDSKGDVNSMHKLLYRDIRNPSIRDSILKYIEREAQVQKAHATIGSRRGKLRNLLSWRKILSDVDDTLTCSGGSWPAGMDASYPKKAVYPGVLAFYRELDLGTKGSDEWDTATRAGNLVFLSARPHVYKSVSENVTYSKFRTLQKERGLYTSPTLLAGSLDTGSQFMVKNDSEPLALKKFENLTEYLALYPEFSCIFVGDNGQGDVRTAEMAIEDSKLTGLMQRVYVHQIQPRSFTYCAHPDSTLRTSIPTAASTSSSGSSSGGGGNRGRVASALKQKRNSERICFFGTYIEAAIDAYEHDLIRASGLRKVMEEAVQDFLNIKLGDWVSTVRTARSGGSNSLAANAAKAALALGQQQQTPQKHKGALNSDSSEGDTTIGGATSMRIGGGMGMGMGAGTGASSGSPSPSGVISSGFSSLDYAASTTTAFLRGRSPSMGSGSSRGSSPGGSPSISSSSARKHIIPLHAATRTSTTAGAVGAAGVTGSTVGIADSSSVGSTASSPESLNSANITAGSVAAHIDSEVEENRGRTLSSAGIADSQTSSGASTGSSTPTQSVVTPPPPPPGAASNVTAGSTAASSLVGLLTTKTTPSSRSGASSKAKKKYRIITGALEGEGALAFTAASFLGSAASAKSKLTPKASVISATRNSESGSNSGATNRDVDGEDPTLGTAAASNSTTVSTASSSASAVDRRVSSGASSSSTVHYFPPTLDCMGYSRGGALVRTFTESAVVNVIAERRRELRLRELNGDIMRGNRVLEAASATAAATAVGGGSNAMAPVDVIEYSCRYNIGSTVITLFGEGMVLNFRKSDGIYEVLIGWESRGEEEAEEDLPPPPPPPPPLPELPHTPASAGTSRSDSAPAAENGSMSDGPRTRETTSSTEVMVNDSDPDLQQLVQRNSSSDQRKFCIRMYIPGIAIHS